MKCKLSYLTGTWYQTEKSNFIFDDIFEQNINNKFNQTAQPKSCDLRQFRR